MKKIMIFAGLLLFMVACSKDKSVQEPVGNDNTVYIRSTGFTPSNMTVGFTSSVTWVNEDGETHTVTSDDASFESNDIQPGESFTYKFSTSGTYKYHCTYHPAETGTIVAAGIR